MEKKLNKPYARNIRLDTPCGLIGTPPDCTHNVLILAKLSNKQYNKLVEALVGEEKETALLQ